MKKYLVPKLGTLNAMELSENPEGKFADWPEGLDESLADCVDVFLPSCEVKVNKHLLAIKEQLDLDAAIQDQTDATIVDKVPEESKPKKNILMRLLGG